MLRVSSQTRRICTMHVHILERGAKRRGTKSRMGIKGVPNNKRGEFPKRNDEQRSEILVILKKN